MKLAVIHFGKNPTPNKSDIDLNEDRLIELNVQAATKIGADLIVNPEVSILSLSPGSSPLHQSSRADDVFNSRRFAEWFAKERCKRFLERLSSEVAVKYKIHIVAGIIRSVSEYNHIFNSAIILGPDGKTKHIYDKRELTSDLPYAMKGNTELIPAQLDIGNLGVMICADYVSPLISRSLSINGSDLIVIPASLGGPTIKALKVRALENGIPFAMSNCFELGENGTEFDPQSAIVSADGTKIDETNERVDKILSAELNLTGLTEQNSKRKRLDSRRPDLYQGALIDLTSRLLRTDKPQNGDVCVITISDKGVDDYLANNKMQDKLSEAHRKGIPALAVFPEFRLGRREVEKHINFGKKHHAYLVCGFIEGSFQTIFLFGPGGEEVLAYKKVHLSPQEENINRGNRLEHYEDLPFGRIGILSGEDLLYPETVESYKNAGVNLILVASNLGFDGADIFEDIAKYRKTNIAVADFKYKGGIYTRYPKPDEITLGAAYVINEEFVNVKKFNLLIGEPVLNVSPSGYEIITRNL